MVKDRKCLKFHDNYAKIAKDFEMKKAMNVQAVMPERTILFSERGNHRLKVPLR